MHDKQVSICLVGKISKSQGEGLGKPYPCGPKVLLKACANMSLNIQDVLEDSILRCLIALRSDGRVTDQVLDAVRQGENVLIVLEWGIPEENPQAVTPRQYVVIPLSEIEIVPDLSKDYEMVSHTGIDFDAATVADMESGVGRLFQSPPRK